MNSSCDKLIDCILFLTINRKIVYVRRSQFPLRNVIYICVAIHYLVSQFITENRFALVASIRMLLLFLTDIEKKYLLEIPSFFHQCIKAVRAIK